MIGPPAPAVWRGPAPRGAQLRALLRGVPSAERDGFVEQLLGIRDAACDATPPGDELIGYHPCGVDALIRCLDGLHLDGHGDEVLVDVGAGLGKVVLLAHLLTGVRAVGIERQAALVVRARRAARALGADVVFEHGDARDGVPAGTVYFLYLPCVGRALDAVMGHLRERASTRPITVCALGMDLSRFDGLEPCEPTDFWLSCYRVG